MAGNDAFVGRAATSTVVIPSGGGFGPGPRSSKFSLMSVSSDPYNAGLPVRRYNQRMARRMAKRAHVNEQGVAVCFAFNNLLTALLIGMVEDVVGYVPTFGSLIGLAISILTFYFHRIVLVTDQNVYVYRDWPFHIPGKQLAAYPRHAGLVNLGSPNTGGFSKFIRRGQLNFEDGHVVYHGILWIRRARYVVQEGNSAVGSPQLRYSPVSAPASLPGAGWFQDPGGQPILRWWDGATWTGHTSPKPE
jgi:hypothetical protein